MTNIASGAWRMGRIAMWGAAGGLLLLPLVAMQFTREVDWGPADFIIIGFMLVLVCGAVELAVRASGHIAFRAGTGVAAVAAFLLIWINLAVGIIGDEGNPANLLFGGVLAVALGGALVARSSAAGMARVMVATALAQGAVAAIALLAGFGATEPPGPAGILALNGFFVALWLLSAWLFATAARASTKAGT